jgi:hypothetical protein
VSIRLFHAIKKGVVETTPGKQKLSVKEFSNLTLA